VGGDNPKSANPGWRRGRARKWDRSLELKKIGGKVKRGPGIGKVGRKGNKGGQCQKMRTHPGEES